MPTLHFSRPLATAAPSSRHPPGENGSRHHRGQSGSKRASSRSPPAPAPPTTKQPHQIQSLNSFANMPLSQILEQYNDLVRENRQLRERISGLEKESASSVSSSSSNTRKRKRQVIRVEEDENQEEFSRHGDFNGGILSSSHTVGKSLNSTAKSRKQTTKQMKLSKNMNGKLMTRDPTDGMLVITRHKHPKKVKNLRDRRLDEMMIPSRQAFGISSDTEKSPEQGDAKVITISPSSTPRTSRVQVDSASEDDHTTLSPSSPRRFQSPGSPNRKRRRVAPGSSLEASILVEASQAGSPRAEHAYSDEDEQMDNNASAGMSNRGGNATSFHSTSFNGNSSGKKDHDRPSSNRDSANPSTAGFHTSSPLNTHPPQSSTSTSGEPSFKYVENLRHMTKDQRKEIPAVDCAECKAFYEAARIDGRLRKDLMNQCGRHRRRFEREDTPPGYWDCDDMLVTTQASATEAAEFNAQMTAKYA